ncbi:hypothetical protein [Nitrincola schmidtii]|uniref:hypothetical protein n=1 Tax=Nitrincola schmidtii TaxID=1730894 RepID=UPI00124DCBBC|nr:hypothetical protein [Nitrincola schmidtii]
MSDVIVEGLFLLGAAISGGVLAIFAGRSSAEVEKLKNQNERREKLVEKLLKQVEAYHLLEDLYASDLSEAEPSKAVKTIKTEYRNKVVELHQCSRPEMTSNEAKKQLHVIT